LEGDPISNAGGIVTTRKIPDWKDDDAIFDYVNSILATVLRDPTELPELYRLHPKFMWEERKLALHKVEEEAIELAEAGNYKAIADLLRNSHPLNNESFNIHPWDRDDFHGAMLPSGPAGTIRSTFAPSTYELIADILAGDHKKPKHRPPATPDERRAMTPAHNAADWIRIIKAILQSAYPKQAASQISDRAVGISARLNGISPRKLRGLLKRARSDRRRLRDP
jgi:hypothetical protein